MGFRYLSAVAALGLLALTGCRRPNGSTPAAGPASPGYTFAVVGDNRGDSEGKPSPVFVRIVEAIRKDAPVMVFNTGDMINGYKGEGEAHLRKLWKGYREAIAPLGVPVHHAPGNHDLFDATSAKLWRELLGPTYYVIDREDARFIVLDSETQPGRLGEKQFAWLKGRLEGAGNRTSFVFLHRPLYPVDGHIGNCMDLYPKERDDLHRLFVRHKDRIKGVFLGHEHMYYFENRDGVPYHTVAGGGAELYVPPELGGYFHYLLVRVEGERVTTELKPVGLPAEPEPATVPVLPGALLEGWETPAFWTTWDHSVRKSLTTRHNTDGKQGMKVRFDLSLYPWPVLIVPLDSPRDFTPHASVAVDVYVPPGSPGNLSVKPVLVAQGERAAPVHRLKPGWNTVRTSLEGAWLPPAERRRVQKIQWVLESPEVFAGEVVFDRLRLEGGGGPDRLLEGWESGTYWGVWDSEGKARPEPDPRWHSQGGRGLKIRYDFVKSPYLVLYGTPAAPWDLSRASRLTADVYVPPEGGRGLILTLRLAEGEKLYASPARPLKPGWNRVEVDLDGGWLPAGEKDAVDHVQWLARPQGQKSAGWFTIDGLRAGGEGRPPDARSLP